MEKSDSNPEIGEDSIMNFCLTDQFYVLESLNGRIACISRENGAYAKLPSEIHEKIPGFYHLAPTNAQRNAATKNLFIINPFPEQKNLFVFDVKHLKFKSYSLLSSSDAYKKYILSKKEDILLTEIVEDSTSGEDVGKYYFLSHEKWSD